jgi:hypothetical protein
VLRGAERLAAPSLFLQMLSTDSQTALPSAAALRFRAGTKIWTGPILVPAFRSVPFRLVGVGYFNDLLTVFTGLPPK